MAFLPDSSYTRRKATDTLVIHCADTGPHQDVGAQEIREWHIKERGWKDIGYHRVIRRDGTVEDGRPLWAIGAHVMGHNATSIGVCLVGGQDGHGHEQNNFTPAQWAALQAQVKAIRTLYPSINLICGHRDFPGVQKYCPSFSVGQWLAQHPDLRIAA